MLNRQPNQLPALPRVPSIHEDPLILRISHTGATLLKGGSFKKRFTGGEAVVDINGKIHLSRREYKKAIQNEHAEREAHKESLGFVPKKVRKRIAVKTDPSMPDPVPEKKKYRVNKTEVINRIESMTNAVFSSQRKNAFMGMLTVTFPPAVTEDLAMQAMNTWLTALRQKGKRVIREYLWVSERQDGKRLKDAGKATNTIHYHMLILNRMSIVQVNRAMRVVLCNMVRSGLIDYPLSAMKRYNGVDLAKDRKTRAVTNFCDQKSRKSLSHYITKYVTKNNAEFSHSAWGCSRGFSAIFTAITCSYQEFIKMGWCEIAWQDPAIITEWFDFFPWVKAPPGEFVAYLGSVNRFILEQRGFLN